MCIGFLARKILRMASPNLEVRWVPFWLFWKRVVFNLVFCALFGGWPLGSESAFSPSLLVYMAFVCFLGWGAHFLVLPPEESVHNMHPRGGSW